MLMTLSRGSATLEPMSVAPAARPRSWRTLLNKVPEVTLYFWVIKCLCTTIGETFSDNLTTRWAGGANASVHALDVASRWVMLITVGVLAVLLLIQFTRTRYVAPVYWACIV